MIYFKRTLEYLFKLERGKRFFILFLMSLPVGLGAAITAPHHVYNEWLSNFTVGNRNFLDAMMFNGVANPYRVLIAGVVTVVLLLVCISIMASVISRNLRVGVFSVNRLFIEFNEAIFPSFFAVTSMILVVVLGKVLLGVLLVLFQTISNILLSQILSVFALLINIALVCYAISVGMLYLPSMTINGLRPLVAFAESANKLGGKKGGTMFLSVFLPILLNYVIGGLVSIANNLIVSLVVESVCYALSLVYLITLSFISYYEINELPREDYPREFFFTKIKRR